MGSNAETIAKGEGSQNCAGCGSSVGDWRTCPRNPNAKNQHKDGDGTPGAHNGRGHKKAKDPNHPGQFYAPYLAQECDEE